MIENNTMNGWTHSLTHNISVYQTEWTRSLSRALHTISIQTSWKWDSRESTLMSICINFELNEWIAQLAYVVIVSICMIWCMVHDADTRFQWKSSLVQSNDIHLMTVFFLKKYWTRKISLENRNTKKWIKTEQYSHTTLSFTYNN